MGDIHTQVHAGNQPENSSALYLPASIILSVLILSATIFVVGGDISRQIAGIEITTTGNNGNTGGAGGTGDNGGNTGGNDNGSAIPQLDLSAYADDDPVKGSDSAKVTIVEFSDFQCPFCGSFFTATYPSLKSEYIDSGKAKIVYRDLPLDTACNSGMGQQLHPMACKAALAAECAADQGKFWEMHDKLFENQQSLSVENMKKWAADFGLNTSTFNACLDSSTHLAEVQNDIAAGNDAGISGTPSFVIIFQKSGDNYAKVSDAVAELQSSIRPDFFTLVGDSSSADAFGVVVVGAQRIDAFRTILDAGAAA